MLLSGYSPIISTFVGYCKLVALLNSEPNIQLFMAVKTWRDERVSCCPLLDGLGTTGRETMEAGYKRRDLGK